MIIRSRPQQVIHRLARGKLTVVAIVIGSINLNVSDIPFLCPGSRVFLVLRSGIAVKQIVHHLRSLIEQAIGGKERVRGNGGGLLDHGRLALVQLETC